MRNNALAVAFVLAACSTKVQQDRAPAQPTVSFPEVWAEGEAGAAETEPAAEETGATEGEIEQEKAPAEEGTAGPITHLCCETTKVADKGSELSGCKVIEGGAAAQNACLDQGKTFKACEDAECGQGRCRCSN
jgi:hypothetical protein